MSWDNVGPNQCHMDGTPIIRKSPAHLQIKKETKAMKEDDFGFSIVDESDLTTVVERYDKAEKLRDMIMPLLNNLKSNPDKDIIRWSGPERVRRIDEFIKKMNDLVDG